jgi:hypothetical protein
MQYIAEKLFLSIYNVKQLVTVSRLKIIRPVINNKNENFISSVDYCYHDGMHLQLSRK